MQNIFIKALSDTLAFAPRILVIIFLSLFICGVLIEMGLFKKLEFIGRPLVRLANLPAESAVCFVTSMGSIVAGNTMLAEFYRAKRMSRKQVFLSGLLNGIPVYIKESFTYQIPVILPILGMKVGGIYFLSFLTAGIVKAFFVVLYGKNTFKDCGNYQEQFNVVCANSSSIQRKFKEMLGVAFRREIKVFLKMSLMFMVMTFSVFLLVNNGALIKLTEIIQPLTGFFKLPASAALPVGTYILNPLLGISSIGAMLKEGLLDNFQAVIACMIGSLLMLPVFSLRYSLAKYTAIFGFSLGTSIVCVSTALGMLVKAVFLLVFLLMI